jgi:integrase
MGCRPKRVMASPPRSHSRSRPGEGHRLLTARHDLRGSRVRILINLSNLRESSALARQNVSHYKLETLNLRSSLSSASGKPRGLRNVLRALYATGKKIGLHSLRRFRTETLRRARVPEDLTKLWLGHSKESVTDFYAGGLLDDLAWRQEWCEPNSVLLSMGYLGYKMLCHLLEQRQRK